MNNLLYFISYIIAAIGVSFITVIVMDFMMLPADYTLSGLVGLSVFLLFTIMHIILSLYQAKKDYNERIHDIKEEINRIVNEPADTDDNENNAIPSHHNNNDLHYIMPDKLQHKANSNNVVNPQPTSLGTRSELSTQSDEDVRIDTEKRIEELKQYDADFLHETSKRDMHDPKEIDRLQKFMGQIKAKTSPPPTNLYKNIQEAVEDNKSFKTNRTTNNADNAQHVGQPLQANQTNVNLEHHVLLPAQAHAQGLSNNILSHGTPELYLQSIISTIDHNPQFYHCLAALLDSNNAIIPYQHWYHELKNNTMLATLDMMLFNRLQEVMEKKAQKKVMLAPYFFMSLSRDSMNEPKYSEHFTQFIDDFYHDKKDHPILQRIIMMMSADSNRHSVAMIETLIQKNVNFCLDGARLTTIDPNIYKDKGYIFLRLKYAMIQQEVKEEGVGSVLRAKNKIEQAGLDIIVTDINDANKADAMKKLDIKYSSGNFYEKAFAVNTV